MGGHGKKNNSVAESFSWDGEPQLPIKSRHGKKKSQIVKEEEAHRRLVESDQPIPGHEESNVTSRRGRGPKKKSR